MNLFWFVGITDALYLFYTCGNVTVRSIRILWGDICYAQATFVMPINTD